MRAEDTRLFSRHHWLSFWRHLVTGGWLRGGYLNCDCLHRLWQVHNSQLFGQHKYISLSLITPLPGPGLGGGPCLSVDIRQAVDKLSPPPPITPMVSQCQSVHYSQVARVGVNQDEYWVGISMVDLWKQLLSISEFSLITFLSTVLRAEKTASTKAKKRWSREMETYVFINQPWITRQKQSYGISSS